MQPCRLTPLILLAFAAACGGKSAVYELVADHEAGPPDAAIDVMPANGECPQLPPTAASACATEGQSCAYATGKMGHCDDVGTHDRLAYLCQEGAWLEVARCVDWGSCPSEPPKDGEPCTSVGLDCFYSTAGCDAKGIVQCAGPIWRHVNACAPRSLNTCIGWTPVLQAEESLGETATLDVSKPRIALAGTQLLSTWTAGGGDGSEHSIRGVLSQTAAPSQAASWDGSILIGRDAISNPSVAFWRDRFVIAWAANDGWPNGSGGQRGLFVRTVPLDEDTPSFLVYPHGQAPTGLVLGENGGWVGWRAPGNVPIYTAAMVAPLDPSLTPLTASITTVADEGEQEGSEPSIPYAAADPVRLPDGTFAIAYPAPASGDLWDDSGIVVNFMADTTSTSVVRATVGLVYRLSAASLSDGSVVIGYTLALSGADEPWRMSIVRRDQTVSGLPSPPADGEVLTWGPKIVGMDDGFLVAWTTSPDEMPADVVTLHIAAWDIDGSQGPTVERTIPGQHQGDIDVAYSKEDRSLHAVWRNPASGTPGPLGRVVHQRWVCGPGIK